MNKQESIHHFYQDKDWNNALLGAGETVIYEEIRYNNIPCGGFVAIKKKLNMLPYNYLRITFGPDIDYNSTEILQQALDRIMDVAKNNDSIYVQVNPFTWGPENESITAVFAKKGFRKIRRYIYEATILLDLAKSEEELFQDFERRGKEAVRQSERRGITSEQVEINPENMEKIYAMYADTCKRSGMIADAKEKMFNWSLFFAKKGMAFLFFAKFENKEVCGFLAFKCGNCLSLIYQGSDYSGDIPNRRPANNLYWHTIKWAKQQGYKWFDLAGVSLDAEKGSKRDGILLYKRQFGGEICIMPGNFEFVNRPMVKRLIDILMPIYSVFALALLRKRRR